MNVTKDKVFTILLAEDNGSDVERFLRTLEGDLPRQDDEQVEVVINATAEGALRRLRERPVDVVITDIRMPDMSGIELMHRITQFDHRIPVLVASSMDSVDMVIEALRHGAFDYIIKPFEQPDLAARVHHAMHTSEVLHRFENETRPRITGPFNDIVYASACMRTVTKMIDAIATTSATTLIIGETGTGKELIAKAIHERSDQNEGPFQLVDCTMFSEGVIESELFGHVRGAFTGAVSDKQGLIESGSKGTVLFDEIGDIPMSLQAKLLRVLEEGEVRAVGSTHQKKIQARFIAATNQDLAEKVHKGEFRKDLFYRLNVMMIRVPALRDRKEDIPVLARHFIHKYADEFGKTVEGLDPSAMTELVAYPWPGNVRELRNVIKQAVMLAKGDRIGLHDLIGIDQGAAKDPWVSGDYLRLPYSQAKDTILAEFNHRYLSFKLANNEGNVTRAAIEAGLPRPYFHEIMRRYRRQA
jgi:two-component system, NtrC family, response regulator AtoC